MTPTRWTRIATFALALSLLAPTAGAVVFEGVNLPVSVQAEGKTLRLQGYGLRKKLIFKVYVGALYLTVPTTDAAAAMKADEPKRIALTLLRDVNGKDMREALEEGIFKNAQDRYGVLKPRIEQLLGLLGDKLTKGQELSFTYLPGKGTELAIAGTPRGAVPGKDFMEAFWSIWLGDLPPSADLKQGMLGLAKR